MRDQTDLRGQSQRHPGRSVKNFRSCQSDAHGRGCAAGERTNATGVSRASPSGRNPISRGVREKSRSARTHIVTAMTTPIVAAASGKPSTLMPATQSGEKTTPPMLAPLYAMDSAARRVRTNHGETIALTGAAPIAAQPASLKSVETKSCQGAVALDQPRMPTAKEIAPAFVATGTPKRI